MNKTTGLNPRRLFPALGLSLTLCACTHPPLVQELESAPEPKPAYSTQWQRAGLGKAAPSSVPEGNSLVDAKKTYDLPSLIDLALSANPETSKFWEETKAAAAKLGKSEAAWYPSLTALAFSGYTRETIVITTGALLRGGFGAFGGVHLAWLLLDFGGRQASIDASSERLLASHLSFTRKQQEIAFRVAQNFFAYQSSLARVDASRAVVQTANEGVASVQARLQQGLATRPEVLMALQDQAKANFDLQEALGATMDTLANLHASLGISPSVNLNYVNMNQLPLPKAIETTAEQIVDDALKDRPDLAARMAELRAREAEVKKAWSEFWPKFSVQSRVGDQYWSVVPSGSKVGSVNHTNLYADATLTMEWNLFDGFERVNAAKEAEARRNIAKAELQTLELEIIREIWKSYADLKTALRKRDYAIALKEAAQESYQAAHESYQHGLSTTLDLLTAQRDLARARFAEIDSRTSLLQSAASLVYSAGGMTGRDQHGTEPAFNPNP